MITITHNTNHLEQYDIRIEGLGVSTFTGGAVLTMGLEDVQTLINYLVSLEQPQEVVQPSQPTPTDTKLTVQSDVEVLVESYVEGLNNELDQLELVNPDILAE